MKNDSIPDYERIRHFDGDIAASRKQGSHDSGAFPPEAFATLCDEAERFLAGREIESTERIEELMQELESAVMVNNDPRARALLRDFEARYRPEIVRSEM